MIPCLVLPAVSGRNRTSVGQVEMEQIEHKMRMIRATMVRYTEE